jgi:hypothetical protein
MSRIPFAVACAALAATFVGCAAMQYKTVAGSGRVEREDRDVSNFKTVTLAGSGELVIQQGSTEELTIEADDNLIPLVLTNVSGGDLTIRWEDGVNAIPSKPVRFLLTVKDLTNVNLTGSGSLTADDFTGDSLTISISGSADAHLNAVTLNDLTTSISGSGNIIASGSANTFTIKVAGSGDVKAVDLKASTVNVKVAGSGDADVWASDKLNVSVAGSGDIRYRGEPKNVSQSIAGSGSVTSLNQK